MNIRYQHTKYIGKIQLHVFVNIELLCICSGECLSFVNLLKIIYSEAMLVSMFFDDHDNKWQKLPKQFAVSKAKLILGIFTKL